MIAAIGHRSRRAWLVAVVLLVALGCAAPRLAQQAPDPPASDLLNAVLWMQRSVEYKATALTAFALARIRLDQALADPNWTAGGWLVVLGLLAATVGVTAFARRDLVGA